MTHRQDSARTLGFLAGSAAALAATPALAQPPRVGEVRRLPVLTVCLQVGSTERENRQVVYTPPPGWYVRSHTVDCRQKYGNCSYAVNTVPQDWSWSSEDKVRESYKVLLDMAAKAEDTGAQARFAQEQERLLSELRKARSTHHALVVEATARGEGFLKGGGGLQLTVTAELVYVGTDEDVARDVARRQAGLK